MLSSRLTSKDESSWVESLKKKKRNMQIKHQYWHTFITCIVYSHKDTPTYIYIYIYVY